jgi:tetratricopeptide (TPR) repeat protein
LNAESLQREAYPDFALLCTLWGFRYCDLLLDLGDHTEAERRARQLLKATNRTPREWFLGKLDTVFCALTLSRAIRSRSTAGGAGTCAREKAFADEAVAGFRAVGKQEFLVQGLLERTSVLNSSGDFDGAKADLDGAFEIAERSSMKLYLADIHLHRARLFFREKPYPWTSPQADLAAARQLIESCGYWRRKEELEVAEKAI